MSLQSSGNDVDKFPAEREREREIWDFNVTAGSECNTGWNANRSSNPGRRTLARSLSLLPFNSLPFLFFATSNSYSDINGRARLAARHYGVPRAKTSRKMLEFMLAFAHLPPHPFSSLSMALSLSLSPSHPLSLSLYPVVPPSISFSTFCWTVLRET